MSPRKSRDREPIGVSRCRPDSRSFHSSEIIAINPQEAGAARPAREAHRPRPPDVNRGAGSPEIHPREPREDRLLHCRIDDVHATPTIDPGPPPSEQPRFGQQPQLSTDGRAAQAERLGDIRRVPNPSGDERHDLAPGCIREELDALRTTPWHGFIPRCGRAGENEPWRFTAAYYCDEPLVPSPRWCCLGGTISKSARRRRPSQPSNVNPNLNSSVEPEFERGAQNERRARIEVAARIEVGARSER